nr:hypothetical protein Iba_chr12cCG10600 [Ipomoea batatas]
MQFALPNFAIINLLFQILQHPSGNINSMKSYANSRRVFNHVAMLEIQEENSGEEDEIGQLFQQGFRGVRDGLCCLAAMGPAANDGVAAA